MASTFALTIRDGMETEIIEWPIVRSTAKAVLVATPGGELWLPLWRFQKRGYRADEAGQIIALLADVSATASDARVRVWRAGAGPSGKSHKFQIAVRRQSSDSHGQPTTEVRRRCFTLPLSQIKGSRGNWSAPAWLLKKRLANGETLARGVLGGARSSCEPGEADGRSGVECSTRGRGTRARLEEGGGGTEKSSTRSRGGGGTRAPHPSDRGGRRVGAGILPQEIHPVGDGGRRDSSSRMRMAHVAAQTGPLRPQAGGENIAIRAGAAEIRVLESQERRKGTVAQVCAQESQGAGSSSGKRQGAVGGLGRYVEKPGPN